MNDEVKSQLRKDAQIYKRTKTRRIRKKVLKRLKDSVFIEIDKMVEERIESFINDFAPVGLDPIPFEYVPQFKIR